MHRSGSTRTAIVLATVLACAACGGSDGGSGPDQAAAVALGLTTAPPGTARNRERLSPQPVVQLRDAAGHPVARAGVVVTVTGGSLLGTATVTTAGDGSATFTDLALAGAAGPRTLTFQAAGLTSATASVTLSAGAAARIAAHAGDGQWAAPGAALPIAPAVVVSDVDGNRVAGVAVAFGVSAGDGAITGATQVTDASGIARLGGWTLGTSPGANALTATATDLAGSPVVFGALATIAAGATFATGGAHSCALTAKGAAYCWGRDEADQLGIAAAPQSCTVDGVPYPCSLVPAPVQGGLTFTQITAGETHTCALTPAGMAYCWGHNDAGQLGDGSTTYQEGDQRPAPTPVAGGLVFTAISAGRLHTCGITVGGAAYCWGINVDGELGDGTTTIRPTPVAVTGGLAFTSITAGGYGSGMTCAIATTAAAYCWGENLVGQLGIGSDDRTGRPAPQAVAGGLAFASLSAGATHVCGTTTAGDAYCWGLDLFGTLGDGTTTRSNAPVAAGAGRGLRFAEAMAAGYANVNAHSCALTIAGRAYCWGENGRGELGDGTQQNRLDPTAVSSSMAFTHIDGGFRHTCARAGTGPLYCWGSNGAGQLGVNSTTSMLVPVLVSDLP